MLYPKADSELPRLTKIDVDLWRHYIGMPWSTVGADAALWCGRAVDDLRAATRKPTLDKHLAVFEEIAPAAGEAQQERGLAFVGGGWFTSPSSVN